MRAAFSQLPTENWRKHSPIRQKSMNVESFISLARKYTDIQELTGEIIREFVEKIIVFKAEKWMATGSSAFRLSTTLLAQ